ncbi:hypothetical protein B0A50_05283 [Salinomyces thailandicus]|uniref:Uncharacterized protein n=1 Tax=Salinomyces thailandicus TaxID=706561 RepID=A0A4U0TW00_9PEZI|nr:hypothetical protein B0A50_05283 [Salinomyces thailandica]
MTPTKGTWSALCCTSKAATQVANIALENQYSDFLVVIKDLEEQYSNPSKPPTEPFEPPFVGQDVETCWETLAAMIVQTRSDLDSESFAILDDRSAEDESALLVLVIEGDAAKEGFEIDKVRVDLRLVSFILQSWNAKGDNIPELEAEAARSPDGVVRRV